MSQFDEYNPSTQQGSQMTPESMVAAIRANVNDSALSDTAFRVMVRNLIGASHVADAASPYRGGSQFDDRLECVR
jgi:hypothetical protein